MPLIDPAQATLHQPRVRVVRVIGIKNRPIGYFGAHVRLEIVASSNSQSESLYSTSAVQGQKCEPKLASQHPEGACIGTILRFPSGKHTCTNLKNVSGRVRESAASFLSMRKKLRPCLPRAYRCEQADSVPIILGVLLRDCRD